MSSKETCPTVAHPIQRASSRRATSLQFSFFPFCSTPHMFHGHISEKTSPNPHYKFLLLRCSSATVCSMHLQTKQKVIIMHRIGATFQVLFRSPCSSSHIFSCFFPLLWFLEQLNSTIKVLEITR